MQSDKEVKLHKVFDVWHELTTFTRYLVVLMLGITLYDFSNEMAFIFLFSLLINGACYYSMKSTLEDIIKEKANN